ncbi:uncharacterized protein TNCV_949431 [Trichonephila clavipes]|nr:uncharacterized protein TNCV_949431 [Trichonephila clavipes]
MGPGKRSKTQCLFQDLSESICKRKWKSCCSKDAEEDKASNVQASTSVRRVEEALDLPRSTVQKIMRNIVRYYPYKLQLVKELLPHDFETRYLSSLQFLARLEVDPEWPWNILICKHVSAFHA